MSISFQCFCCKDMMGKNCAIESKIFCLWHDNDSFSHVILIIGCYDSVISENEKRQNLQKQKTAQRSADCVNFLDNYTYYQNVSSNNRVVTHFQVKITQFSQTQISIA